MADPDHLFVYGTLRRGHPHPMATRLDEGARYAGPARWRGRLFDLGTFPAAVGTADGPLVVGDLYTLTDTALISDLDAYEEVDPSISRPDWYVREAHPVWTEDGTVHEAWVYRYTGRVHMDKEIVGGDYLAYLRESEARPA